MDLIYRICMNVTGVAVGAGLGLALSLIVLVMLTMISTDQFINIYFGAVFGALGIMMLLKLYRKNKIVNIDFGQ